LHRQHEAFLIHPSRPQRVRLAGLKYWQSGVEGNSAQGTIAFTFPLSRMETRLFRYKKELFNGRPLIYTSQDHTNYTKESPKLRDMISE